MATAGVNPALSTGFGYGIVLGLGYAKSAGPDFVLFTDMQSCLLCWYGLHHMGPEKVCGYP
jgi:hypothetical protein